MDTPRRPLFLFIFLSVFASGAPLYAGEKVPIGVSLPLTGPASAYGQDLLRVIRFFNSRGPNYDLKIEDDKCDPKQAVAIAQKFTTLEKVRFVIGMPCSGTVLASAAVYERAKVPVIAIGPGAPTLSNIGRYIFRTRPSSDGSVCLLANHLAKRHRSLSIVAEQTEFAQSLARAFLGYWKSQGNISSRHDFLSSDVDYNQLATLTLKERSEAVVIFTQAEPSLSALVRALKTQKVSKPIYSETFPGSPTFIKLTGEGAEGIEYSVLAPSEEMMDQDGRELLAEFERQGAFTTVNYVFGLTEAAFAVMEQALNQPSPADFMHSKVFASRIGTFRFAPSGDLVGIKYVLRRIDGGRAITLPVEEGNQRCPGMDSETQ